MIQQPIKYISEFHDPSRVLEAARLLKKTTDPERTYQFMEFCGGHTHVIFRYGLNDILPPAIKLIHGPGCPVCVLPRGRIDSVIELLKAQPNLIVCTYADLMRVPGSQGVNFIKMKAAGSDIRMVYSPDDALAVAKSNPEKKVVFLAIGFETTAPATACVIAEAKSQGVRNFFIYCLHLLTPPAVQSLMDSPEVRQLGAVRLDGFIGPGHVSAVIGTEAFQQFAETYQKPVVITGFSPLDLIQALIFLVQMTHAKKYTVYNQYSRVVSELGNKRAREIISRVFEPRPVFEWRGLGQVPQSAFRMREEFSSLDAEIEFEIKDTGAADHPACLCGSIIRGLKTPLDCKLFAKGCTPENPIGSCMVSSEGTCAAYYAYRK